MPVTIVLAKLEPEQVLVSDAGRDLGKRPIMDTLFRPVAMIWLLSGEDEDVRKATTYAQANGYTVLTFPTDEPDPLGSAKRAIAPLNVVKDP
jgi:hypothetical protein